MNKSMKQLLSALLVIAMMATLLVVPAAAAAGDPGTSWVFNDAKWETAAGTTVDDLVVGAGLNKQSGKNHLAGTGTIGVPVTGPCDVKVTYYYQANGKVGDAAFATASGSTNNFETQSYTYTGTGAGTVEIVLSSTSYLTRIDVESSSDGANTVNTLTADKDSVSVQEEAASTINACINGTVTDLYAFSDDTTKATVEVTGNTVKVTGVAAGSANVVLAVSATALTTVDAAKAAAVKLEVPVTVTAKPTGPVYAEKGTHSYQSIKDDSFQTAYKGITFTNFKAHAGGHGPVNDGTPSVTISLEKKATVTVETCTYGPGCTFSGDEATGITASSGTLTVEKGTETGDGTQAVATVRNADAGDLTISFTGTTYVHSISVEYIEDVEVTPTNGKVDVWDFGAQALDTAKFNNKLDVATINAWYGSSVAAGTDKQNLASFDATKGNGVAFNDGGKSSTHRLRSNNTALTRYDNNTKTGAQGADPFFPDDKVTYNGYVYSNSSGASTVYLSLAVNKGDTVTYLVGSNSNPATYIFEAPSGAKTEGKYEQKGGVDPLTFYPSETGTYKLYCKDEKLVVARIYRQSATAVTVSGAVTAPTGIPAGYQIVFTDLDNGGEEVADVTSGNYSVDLFQGHRYTMSLKGADEYVIATDKTVDLTAETGTTKTLPVEIKTVAMSEVTMTISGVTTTPASTAKLVFTPVGDDAIYLPPQQALANGDVTVKLEQGRTYTLSLVNANDYTVGTTTPATVKFDAATGTLAVPMVLKDTYKVTIDPEGLTLADLATATFTLTSINDTYEGADGKDAFYTYTFTGPDAIALRDGQYKIAVTGITATQKLTPDVKVNGADVTRKIVFTDPVTPEPIAYKDTVTVGAAGKDSTTIQGALDLIARMTRTSGQRVTVMIDPGNYEEQVQVNVPNVTLKNAKADEATLELKNKGVDIGDNEVRITWYYGEKHDYYSMTANDHYDADTLAVNKENGYLSHTNKTGKVDDHSYWNSTVSLNTGADGFEAEGIIFENSYNQYISAKCAEDVVVPKAASTPSREGLGVGDTTVQEKGYVGQAAALGMGNGVGQASFDHCAFIGRQDILFGGTGDKMAFYDCDIYGATDYIMGYMNAVFAKCDLVMNTNEKSSSDVAYITAGQTDTKTPGPGYLFWNCTVRSPKPGVETASTVDSKPGTFGRPWQGDCEVVFYETIVNSTTTQANGTTGPETSLIQPEGWTNGLSGTFKRCVEYHTHEMEGAKRVNMSSQSQGQPTVLTEPVWEGKTIDYATWMGDWNPFEGKDMTIVGCPDQEPGGDDPVVDSMTIAPTSVSVRVGATKTATATVTGYTGKNVYAISDDASVAAVAVNGKTITVTGVTEGTTNVYVIMSDTTTVTVDQAKADPSMKVLAVTVTAKATATTSGGVTSGRPDGDSSETDPTSGNTIQKTSDRQGNVEITVTAPDGEVIAEVKLPGTVPSVGYKFVDVPDDHWAAKAINDMAGLGMVKGVDDVNHIYDMTSATSRGAVATILFRLSNGKAGLSEAFNDVAAEDWYGDAVAWAAKNGVVTGYNENTFAPNDMVTREQLAVMLFRYAKLLGLNTTNTTDMTKFADGAAIDAWATEAMTWAVASGIIKGKDAGVLDPTAAATRAETAVMFDRFVSLMK